MWGPRTKKHDFCLFCLRQHSTRSLGRIVWHEADVLPTFLYICVSALKEPRCHDYFIIRPFRRSFGFERRSPTSSLSFSSRPDGFPYQYGVIFKMHRVQFPAFLIFVHLVGGTRRDSHLHARLLCSINRNYTYIRARIRYPANNVPRDFRSFWHGIAMKTLCS